MSLAIIDFSNPVFLTPTFWVIFTISGISLVTDLLWRKIFNWLTLPAILFGFLFHAFGSFTGASEIGVLSSFLGMLVGLMLTVWMFSLGAMGAGDVKLLMAFGAWGGLQYVLDVFVLSLVVGGVMSFGVLIYQKRLTGFFKKLYDFFVSLFIKNLKVTFPKFDHNLTIPFGVPMALAAILTLVGLRVW